MTAKKCCAIVAVICSIVYLRYFHLYVRMENTNIDLSCPVLHKIQLIAIVVKVINVQFKRYIKKKTIFMHALSLYCKCLQCLLLADWLLYSGLQNEKILSPQKLTYTYFKTETFFFIVDEKRI